MFESAREGYNLGQVSTSQARTGGRAIQAQEFHDLRVTARCMDQALPPEIHKQLS